MAKIVGVVTPGGDAPGMNAAIRGVTRIAHAKGFQVLGFERGWDGLLTNSAKKLTPRSVGGIIQSGGTILHTLRCQSFEEEGAAEKGAETLSINNVDALIVIGGDGSFKGALDLSVESDALMIGIPATIDNDVFGTDETIGFDTAVNTAVSAIDKIRDTAISHERIFIVEVMGRKRGFLALEVGICVGAEVILIPERPMSLADIAKVMDENAKKGKRAGIIVAAEGCGNTHKLAQEMQQQTESEVRLSILGYAQRGGSPTARSRLLASLFAQKAVDLICQGQGNMAIGLENGAVVGYDLEKAARDSKPIDLRLFDVADMLAT
ncbi:MAG TPA: ATP-dependent 6-phosphofructokinase [Candidatus Limnocylindrales bacterium]|nr:ATP-dependent 6-phosphofructokinase [Candidatus Limnocylindrales bacterium]